MRRILVIFLVFVIFSEVFASEIEYKPEKKDKCPVCGMFVYKYKDFLALIVLDNGNAFWFDGAKDFFKFYLNPEKYRKDVKKQSFQKFYVTDYYTLKLIDAKRAFYVIGSDVLGPMGNELIPFESIGDAKEFLKDHGGKKILKFNEVDIKLLKELD